MLFSYKENMPIVKITIISDKGRKEFDANIDFATTKTLVPSSVSEELHLEFKGFISVATGSGIILMPLYKDNVKVFERVFSIYIACSDLPRESPIQALLGRDILDDFKVCLDGKKKEVEVKDP
ncbi:MAG: hypothetical protein ACUVTD_02185 [Nitrososphaerales archaeon]